MIKNSIDSGVGLILIGFVLLVLGWIFPVLMVLKVIEATFWLSFLSHGASVGGLFVGLIGIARYAGEIRKRDE